MTNGCVSTKSQLRRLAEHVAAGGDVEGEGPDDVESVARPHGGDGGGIDGRYFRRSGPSCRLRHGRPAATRLSTTSRQLGQMALLDDGYDFAGAA